MNTNKLLCIGLFLSLGSSIAFASATPKQLKCTVITPAPGTSSNTIVLTQTNSTTSPSTPQSYTASGTIILPSEAQSNNTPAPVNLGCISTATQTSEAPAPAATKSA